VGDERLRAWRGMPKAIRCDNGPELTSQVFVDWCERHQIEICYIQPSKPNQNAFIERFNRTYREEVLNSYLFEDLDPVREITHQWLIAYNERRPHDALGGLSPTVFGETQLVPSDLSRPERREVEGTAEVSALGPST
jgi:putative transposase